MTKEEIIRAQKELIDILTSQVIDLTMMSKIELGDDVIAAIKRINIILMSQNLHNLQYLGQKLKFTERTELLKQAMGEENYNKAVDELMPFGGGMSEYFETYKIPYYTINMASRLNNQ